MIKVKKIFALICIVLIGLTINSKVYAADCSSIENSASSFINAGQEAFDEQEKKSSNKISKSITDEIQPIVKILMIAGFFVVSFCMVILGIQWVMAKPSPEAQAKLKERFFTLVIIAAIIFGGYTIWAIVVKILTGIFG